VTPPDVDEYAPTKVGNRKYRWDDAKDWYLNHVEDVPLSQVADMFSIPRDQLYNRSGRERWQYQRLQHQTALLRERRRKRQFSTVKEAEQFDDGALATAKLGASLITGRLAQIAELFNAKKPAFALALQTIRNGGTPAKEDLYSAVYYKEMVELAKAMELYQTIGRRALGTDTQTISMILDGDLGAAVEAAATELDDALAKADPDRIAAMFDALCDAGIAELALDEHGEVIGFDLDGEVVDPEVERSADAVHYTSTEQPVTQPTPGNTDTTTTNTTITARIGETENG
jgi:hypothetical protein